MAARCCRVLRTALAAIGRSARFGPNLTHAHRSVTRSVVFRLSPEQSSALWETQRLHRRDRGDGGHREDGGRRGRRGAVLWAALAFSLFGRSEEDEAQRKEDDMILLLKKAKLSIHRGQMNAASSFLHQALALAQQLHNQQALVYCYSLMANLAYVRGQLDHAEKLFKASLSVMLSGGTPEDDNAVIETSLKLATIYAEQNRLELAEHGFRFCIESLEGKLEKEKEPSTEEPSTEEPSTEEPSEEQLTLLKDTRLLLGLVLDSRARFRTSTSDLHRAEQDYRRSLQICTEEQGAAHPQTLVLLSDLASVLDLQGKHEEALALVQRAVDLGRTQEHPDQHVLLSNMAAILLHSGDFDGAARFYHEALVLARQTGDQEAVEHIQEGLKEVKAQRRQQRAEEEATDDVKT